MKIIFQKQELVNAINVVNKAVPSRTTMPILECILIDAAPGSVTLTANDMEIGIRTKAAGTVEETGRIAINSRIFSDIIRKLPDGEVIIETISGSNVNIKCEKTSFDIAYLPADEFTELPSVERKNYISISQFSLKEIIKQTIFSIAANDNNKMMNGELFEVKDDVLRVVALDGYRIAIRRIALKDHYEDESVIVPGKSLNEVSRILSDKNDSEVIIYFSENHILFEFEDTIVVSRLVEGKYFDIDHIIRAADHSTTVKIKRQEFMSTIDRAMLLVNEEKKPVIISVKNDEMYVSAVSYIGSLKESIPVEKAGNDITIGFNPKYIQDALKVIDDEDICMYMVNPRSPCFIRNDEEGYDYMILPVNI